PHDTRLAARADEGCRVPGRHEQGPARRPEDGPAGPVDPGDARTGRLQGDRGAVPRPERPAGRPAALAEHRGGDGTSGFAEVMRLRKQWPTSPLMLHRSGSRTFGHAVTSRKCSRPTRTATTVRRWSCYGRSSYAISSSSSTP